MIQDIQESPEESYKVIKVIGEFMKAEVLSVTWGREKKQNEKSKPFET